MAMSWFSAPEHQPFEYASVGDAAVLLIHGFMGTPAEMRPLGAAVADAGITARGVLLPGMGADIDRLGNIGRDDWVQAAREAFDNLSSRFEQVSVIGYSLGGAVALHLASTRPVHRLVLIAPLWKLLGGHPGVLLLPVAKRVVRQFRPFAKADFHDPGVRQFFEGSMSTVDLDDPVVQRELRQESTLPTATLDELRRTAAACDDLAARVTAPTLVLQGTDDTAVHAKNTRRLLGQFRGELTYRQIPGDHFIIREDRDAWRTTRNLVVPFVAGDTSLPLIGADQREVVGHD